MPFGRKQDRKIAGDHPNSFSLYFIILCLLAFLFSLLCAVWHSKRSSLHIAPPPHVRVTLKYISMYFLIVCRLVFLFSLLCAVWQKTRSQNRRRPSKFIFFVFPHCVPASLFIFFTLCRLAENKIAHCTSAPRASDLEIYFFVFPYCVPASLFIFFTCAVWQKTRSQNRRRPSKFIFFVFPHCVPASLFIFFTLCRLAEYKIAKSQETIKFIFFVLSYFVPASLFIFFTWCRLAFRTSLSTLHLRPTCEWPWNKFLCISLLCAG